MVAEFCPKDESLTGGKLRQSPIEVGRPLHRSGQLLARRHYAILAAPAAPIRQMVRRHPLDSRRVVDESNATRFSAHLFGHCTEQAALPRPAKEHVYPLPEAQSALALKAKADLLA